MMAAETIDDLDLEGWLRELQPLMVAWRDLGDGRYACVCRLLFHYTLIVGQIGDCFGYDDRWCYETEIMARAALEKWNPTTEAEPIGWHRHPKTGRRRSNGNQAEEYVRF